jgi:predicted ATPase
MSIRLLEVEGFKSLKEVSWRPGNLNVVIGPNGSGKSNLLDLVDLVRAAADGKLKEKVQQQGGIDSLLWDGRSHPIQLRLTVYSESWALDYRDVFNYGLILERSGPWSGFRVTGESLESVQIFGKIESTILIQRDGERASFYDDKSEELVVVGQRFPEEEALLSVGSAPVSPAAISFLSEEVESWSTYRGFDTTRDASVRQSALTRPEKVVSPDGDNLVAVLHTLYTENRDFRNELNSAMRAAFSDNFEELIFPPAADLRVQLRVNWKHLKRSQPSAMLSDGTLRFLYLMAILANPEPPALIAIEEPEVGLHPSMFPIIAEYAAQASKRTQVIFTTHSADFLDAFRDTGVAPTTTVTQWRDGATTLKVLEGEELAYWLREYTLGQLFRSSELEQIG